MKRWDWKAWAVIGTLAAVVGVALPLQTYLGNADIYPYSFLRLLPELLGFFVVFCLGLWSIGKALAPVRLSPLPFYAALTVCVYLESGLLSLGIPELNGGFIPMLSSVSRGAADACVWGVVLVLFVVCSRWLKPFLHWISLAVLVLVLASLVDVRKPSVATRSRPADMDAITFGFESQPTVLANVRYSPVRNILIFILDSMPGVQSAEIVRSDPALRSKFSGFTAYPNNIGMHECTKRGVPGLVTGRHYDPDEISEGEYPMTMYGTNSFVTAAVRGGWNVAFSPDLLPYGFTNLPVKRRVGRDEKRRARDRFAFLRQSTEVPFLSLFDAVAFRLSPFAFKGPILYSRIRHAVKGRHSAEGFWGEKTMYPALAACPVNDDARPFLGVFHSWGAHPPWEGDLPLVLAGKLANVAALMDACRARGLYDKSMILVTSDHGLDMARAPAGYPPSASALLWVKPQGATGPFAESEAKTSHAHIAGLVKAALKKPLSTAECTSILNDAQPLYRAEVREGGRAFYKDWSGK